MGPLLLSLAFLVQPSAPPAELSLRLPDAKRRFFSGELIRVEVHLKDPAKSHWSPTGFVVDPGPNCDLQHHCGSHDMRTMHRGGLYVDLDRRTDPISTNLNEYVPRLPAGHYTVRYRLRQLVAKDRGYMRRTYVFAEPPVELVSNPIQFEIVPAIETWIRSTVADAQTAIETTGSQARDGWRIRETAAARLRFIDHPLAWRAALDLSGTQANLFDLLAGLLESAHPVEACKEMRERSVLPSYPAGEQFLNIMAAVCAKAEGHKGYEADFEFRGRAAALLASSLSSKTGQARIETLRALLRPLSESVQRHVTPSWAPLVAEVFAASYADAQPHQLRDFLDWQWPLLRSPRMESILDSIIAKPVGNATEAEIRNLALKRLCELNPEKGRQQLLAELRDFRTSADLDVFMLLPPGAVGDIDDVLIENLNKAQSPPYGDGRKMLRLIARYGSPRSLERFKEVYEMQRDPCGAGLIAYFLRVDPAHAESILKRQPWNMHAPAPPCTAELIEQVPPLYMHRVMEEYLAAYVQHSDGNVKGASALALGRYGSAWAEEPLWQAYRYFHDWWKNRREDLEKDEFAGNVRLEQELRHALAHGAGWLTGEAKLKQIDALCLGWGCLHDSFQDLNAWRRPLRVAVYAYSGDDFRAEVAHYTNLRSIEAVERKLTQFPRGTVFQTAVYSPADDARRSAILEQLQKLAAAHEFKLVPTP
ncbi:MAG: hypothetical protein LLG20_21225 [Acidobacteriales bacterium]|nr:hypothetical protein [Terriglobales bacterium]